MSIREIFRFSNLEDQVVGTLIFLFPICFLTIKGWSNAISILLFVAAVISIIRTPDFYFKSRTREFWIFLITLITPFLAELIVQIGRGEIVWRSLDGPSRFLAAALFFVFLSRFRVDCSRVLSFAAIFAVIASSIYVLLVTDHYRDGRAATYFLDSIQFPVYLVALLSLVQPELLNLKPSQKGMLFIFTVGIVALVTIVAISSQSRTSWLALVVLVEAIIFTMIKKNKKLFFYSNVTLIVFILTACVFSEIVQSRTLEVFHNIQMFIQGEQYTSVGLRLGLMLMDIKLFLGFPAFGVPDGQLPPIEWFSAHGLDVYPLLYEQKLLYGSHSEILAHLSRKGVFGIPVIVSLFLIPIFYFSRFLEDEDNRVVRGASMGFKFCLVIFFSSLTVQVFNLKMTSTFYAFILAMLFATLLRRDEDKAPIP